ncbi:MAG: hypothetical protein KDD25_05155, partial [Bdellovibrionales bacterium]|nr:hypothetical protein [Bdellovibrionales bacterium]
MLLSVRKTGILICLLSLGASISCSREVSEMTKIKVKVPKSSNSGSSKPGLQSISTFNTVYPRMVFVNVEYDGEKLAKKWSTCHDCPPKAPPAFEFELPSGKDRLIQVLAVYQAADGTMIFKYGDEKKDLESGEQSVTITIATVGGATETASVAGHWERTDSSTYSGPLTMMAYPKAGRPPMIIEQSEMIGGWFRVFYLDSMPVAWKMANGEILFGGTKTVVADTQAGKSFDPAQTGVAKAALNKGSVPAVFRTDDGGTNYSMEEYPDSLIYGFWKGNFADNTKRATDGGSPGTQVDYLYKETTPGSGTFTPVPW